jgi:pullulanase
MSAARVVRARLESPTNALVEFDRDWSGPGFPPLDFGADAPPLAESGPAGPLLVARSSRYYALPPAELACVLPLEDGSDVDPARDKVYLAGDFNGWQAAGKPEWRLEPAELEGERVLEWRGPAIRLGWPEPQRFKFVTGDNRWVALPSDAPNAVADEYGNVNRQLDPSRTGHHLWSVRFTTPLDLSKPWSVGLKSAPRDARVPVVPGRFFFDLCSDLPLGAIVGKNETTFRLFAPRARAVTLWLCDSLERQNEAHRYPLARRLDPAGTGVWEVVLDQNVHGWFYWYTVDGFIEGPGGFDPKARILDPYALAAADHAGPGIVLDSRWIGQGDRSLATPAWHDLVIAEAHVRDLTARAPIEADPEERRGFTGLCKWVESPEFHLSLLGVNCVELQPVLEFDNRTREEYHWGYMPNSFFAPESGYSLAPAEASGVRELQKLVAAFHRRGIAVILDVVFNHVGEPAHLFFADRLYYFEQDSEGRLSNWSGCGNDLRIHAAMTRRLVIDSCKHLIAAYGVDGFRFDLAELLGVEFLAEAEAELKRFKPDVILIAEPWSYRGHIAGALRDTGWASWNDGFRDFVREYVLGRGEGARLEYFLRGSPWYFAKWPAQTVNYTESHDDRTWIDMITENPNGDGSSPTAADLRRTHLMAALLFMSIGIPMISAGQDFLRSKRGVGNTYLRGDLNALDYRRLHRYAGTHCYFADWIAFRRGEFGRLLRLYSRPSEGFLEFFRDPESPALAALYNADRSLGPIRLLFAINPAPEDRFVPIGEELAASARWRQLADQDHFYAAGSHGARLPVAAHLFVPAIGCGLWISR